MKSQWRPDLEAIPVDEALTLVVTWKKGKELEGRMVRVASDVASALRDACRQTLHSLRESEAVAYGPDAHIDAGEYMAVPRGVVDEETLHILDLLERASGLETLDPRRIPPKLWFYAAVVGDEPKRRAAFIRKMDPHRIAKPGNILATLGETLSRVEQPVFVLESRFDLLALSDGLVVLNTTAFETLFRSAPELGERVPVWAGAITKHLPIDNEGTKRLVEAAKRNSRLARRLRSIYQQGHLVNVTVAQLRREARNQGLDEAALFEGDKLVIDESTDIDALLRLLNEDLFTGGLTGRKYAADRKRVR